MSPRARMIATVLGIGLLVTVGVGVLALRWVSEQWEPSGRRPAKEAVSSAADAAVRQVELGVGAHGELVARARVLAHYGRVLSMNGDTEHATFVVEIRPTSDIPAKSCVSIEFDAWTGRVGKSFRCPENATAVSLPPPPSGD